MGSLTQNQQILVRPNDELPQLGLHVQRSLLKGDQEISINRVVRLLGLNSKTSPLRRISAAYRKSTSRNPVGCLIELNASGVS